MIATMKVDNFDYCMLSNSKFSIMGVKYNQKDDHMIKNSFQSECFYRH